MTESTKPKLFVTIDGEKILASRPKFGLLKKVTRLNESLTKNPDLFDTEEGLDLLFQLILDIFDTDELTQDNIDDVDLESIVSLQEINNWIEAYIPQKKIQETKDVSSMRSNQATKRKTPKKT